MTSHLITKLDRVYCSSVGRHLLLWSRLVGSSKVTTSTESATLFLAYSDGLYIIIIDNNKFQGAWYSTCNGDEFHLKNTLFNPSKHPTHSRDHLCWYLSIKIFQYHFCILSLRWWRLKPIFLAHLSLSRLPCRPPPFHEWRWRMHSDVLSVVRWRG